MGVVMGGFAAASILGVPLSLYLTNIFKHNWHITFIMIGGVGIRQVAKVEAEVAEVEGQIVLNIGESVESSRCVARSVFTRDQIDRVVDGKVYAGWVVSVYDVVDANVQEAWNIAKRWNFDLVITGDQAPEHVLAVEAAHRCGKDGQESCCRWFGSVRPCCRTTIGTRWPQRASLRKTRQGRRLDALWHSRFQNGKAPD